MVGRVGDDAYGARLVEELAAGGVDTSHIRRDPEAPTGIAVITVDPAGQNAIAVSPGANARLTPGDLDQAAGLLEVARVVLLQLEIPATSVTAAALRSRGTVVLNPAPARPLPSELIRAVDVLVPNAGELLSLTGASGAPSPDRCAALARELQGPGAVVVTLGADGALLVSGAQQVTVPAPRVEAVDTTGAGDCFCGALAGALASGSSLEAAVRWAVPAAAASTTVRGAQASFPDRAAVENPERGRA